MVSETKKQKNLYICISSCCCNWFYSLLLVVVENIYYFNKKCWQGNKGWNDTIDYYVTKDILVLLQIIGIIRQNEKNLLCS